MKSGRASVLTMSAAILAAAALSGCNGIGSIGPSGNSTSQVRTVNGLQGCSAVDFEQVNVSPVPFSNVLPGAAPGAYTSIRAGLGLHYGVFHAGTTTNALALSNVDLQPHDANGNANTGTYTLAAAGTCSGASGAPTPQLVRLVDAFPIDFTGSNAGTVGLRIVNLVPDSGTGITLDINGSTIHGTDDSGTNNVEYAGTLNFNTSEYNAIPAPASGAVLTIRSSSNTVIATVPAFNFTANHDYSLFVMGEITPSGGGQAVSVVQVLDF